MSASTAPDATQIAAWKKQHGDIYALQVDELVGYVRKPTQPDIVQALARGKEDGLAVHQYLLENCWLGGDPTLKTDDANFLATAEVFGALFPQKMGKGWKL